MKKVIIADSHREVRERLVEMVRSSEIRVDEVYNGLDLVEGVRRKGYIKGVRLKPKHKGYDLVLISNNLSKINGLDAIKEIRKLNEKIPIYFLHSWPHKKVAELVEKRALKYGANGSLNKLDVDFPEKIEEIKKDYLKE